MSDPATIITALTAVEYGITGLSSGQVFDNTPSSPPDTYPWLFHVLKGGEIAQPPLDIRETVHHIRTFLCFSLQSDLADAERAARPYVKKYIDKIDLNKTLGGTANVVDTNVVSYEYGVINLQRGTDAVAYHGIVFNVDVLEVEQGNLYAA